ncbi:MAG: 3'(2'),5'-bisphosphate nucleotidase [Candidatus Hydrogenedentes bacterium]|nr:3'(2'),5'-bisphosphate nucleotidase [Candidatus Hydrogenedentota bacterium]
MPLDPRMPELKFALEAVREAARAAQLVRNRLDVKGIEKRDLSPVTVADYACQALVARRLHQAFPEAALVGEEDARDLRGEGGGETLSQVTQFVREFEAAATPGKVCDWIDCGNGEPVDRFWCLDPIDGTKGYLRGEQYVVALALIESGKVTLGVLACPNLREDCTLGKEASGALVAAVAAEGAWRAPLRGGDDFTQIGVSSCAEMTRARMLRSVEADHTNVGQLGQLSELLGLESDPVCLDSQAKYAVLSAGGGELLVRLLSASRPDYKEKIWDQAAGSIVLEEAGGRISDLEGRALDFTQGRTLAFNRGVCASNGVLHEKALEAISQLS